MYAIKTFSYLTATRSGNFAVLEMTRLNQIAIVVPARKGGSGGFFKHLYALLDYFREEQAEIKCTIFAPEGVLSVDRCLDFELVTVRSDDFRTQFRRLASEINKSSCQVALNVLARPIKGLQKPSVVVVQNIEPLQKPKYKMSLLWRLRLLLLRREAIRACKAAHRVIAISEKVRAELTHRAFIPAQKIDVVHHGIETDSGLKPVRPLLLEVDSFIFCAGSVVQYRGYEDVVEAVSILRSQSVNTLPVVVAGEPDNLSKKYFELLKSRAEELRVADQILWVGRLSAAEMAWCYKNCDFFVQASRAEACPNIVLESMSFGCMSISCDNEPMPEIYGDSALFYPTGNAAELAQAMKRCLVGDLMNGSARRLEYKNGARIRSTYFTWQKTGELTLASINRALISSG